MSVALDREVQAKTADGYLAQIGRIDSVFLGIEDHGIFTFDLGFDFGGMHQGVGHLCIGSPSRDEWLAKGLKLLHDVEVVCGVRDLVALKGKMVVVLRKSDEMHARIVGIQQALGEKRVIWNDYFPEERS